MKLVLIDDKIDAETILINSFKSDCVVKNIKNYQNSMQLISEIENIEEITHFAMVYFFEGSYTIPYFIESGESSYKYFNVEIMNLITLFKGYNPQIKIDILTCNMNDPEFVETVAKLEEDFEIDIRYSLDQTGNNPDGNWVLESDSVNIREIYFDDSITLWSKTLDLISGVFASGINVLKKYNNYTYLGGSFTNVNNLNINRIARLNPDGTLDVYWNPNCNGVVNDINIDSSFIYIAGNFTTINRSTTRNYIARISLTDTSGTVDSWNPNASAEVKTITTDSSFIYVGGSFTTLGGTARNRAGRYNKSDGTLNTWNPNVGSSVVNKIAVDSSHVYIGGNFTSINTVPSSTRNRLARTPINSHTVDSTWNPNVGTTGNQVFEIVLDSSYIYVGSNATSINGSTTRNRIARIPKSSTTGTVDSWNPNSGGIVQHINYDSSFIYLGGSFTSMGGNASARYYCRTDLCGNLDTTWLPSINSTVATSIVDNSGITIGGSFSIINTTSSSPGFAYFPDKNSINFTENKIQYASIVPGSDIRQIVQDDNYFYVAGQFLTIGNNAIKYLARINKITYRLDASWNPNPSSLVTCLAVDSSYVYLGGTFSNIGGVSRNYIGRISLINNSTGLVDSLWNPNANNIVYTIALDDTNIYVGGAFDSFNVSGVVTSRKNLGRIPKSSATGAIDSFNPITTGTDVQKIVLNNTYIYIGGNFTSVQSTTRNRIARIAKSNDTLDAVWDPNANGVINDIFLGSNHIYLGGGFTNISNYGANSFRRICRISNSQADGIVDANWQYTLTTNGGVDNEVYTVYVDSSHAYIGGNFANIGTSSIVAWNRLARIPIANNSTYDTTWNPYGSEATGEVRSIINTGNDLHFAGNFQIQKSNLNSGLLFTPTRHLALGNKKVREARTILIANGYDPSSNGFFRTINNNETVSNNFINWNSISSGNKIDVRHALLNILQENNPSLINFIMPKTNLDLDSGTNNVNVYIPYQTININDISNNSVYVNLYNTGDNFYLTDGTTTKLIEKTGNTTYLVDGVSKSDGETSTLFSNYVIKLGGAHIYQGDGGGSGPVNIGDVSLNIVTNPIGSSSINDVSFGTVTITFPAGSPQEITIDVSDNIGSITLGNAGVSSTINALSNLFAITLEPSGTVFSDYIFIDISVNSTTNLVIYYNTGASTTLITDNSNNSTTPYYNTLTSQSIRFFTKSFSDIILGNESGGGIGDPFIKPIFGASYYLPNDESTYLLFDNKDNLKLYTKTWFAPNVAKMSFMRYLIFEFNNNRACFDLETFKWFKIDDQAKYLSHSLDIELGDILFDKLRITNKNKKSIRDYYGKRFSPSIENKVIEIEFFLEKQNIRLEIIRDLKYKDIRNNVNFIINGSIDRETLSKYNGSFISEYNVRKVNNNVFFNKNIKLY